MGHYSGAYYLSGYSVECALKACIAKGTLRYDFPDKERVQKSYVHKPLELIKVAGLFDELMSEVSVNAHFSASWNILLNWSEQSRYQTWTKAEAETLLDAISTTNGVLPWLRQRW